MRIVVIGAGVVGLATAAALRDRGADVVCIEADAPMSQRSRGASRIFRLAHGDPELVALAAAAMEVYGEWAERAGAPMIGSEQTVVAGPDVGEWSAAMAAAGVPFDVTDRAPGLPVRSLPGPLLVDPSGGVIDAQAVGRHLVDRVGGALVIGTVTEIGETPGGVRVRTALNSYDADSVVIVAGAGTVSLAASAGIDLGAPLRHHVRFTFTRDEPATGQVAPCLIDRTESWRPDFTSYQHRTAPGRWAVGAHLAHEAVAWEKGRDAVVDLSRRLTSQYVRQCLTGVGTVAVEELYCDVAAGWGDGYRIARRGAVLAMAGDNLFKLAPVLGGALAEAALSGGTPPGVGEPASP
ncbi:hypothetical protein GCM10023403_57690 [Pseudonocardia benzenivorans]|nr:hypothetical protein PSD17_67060 [Pseudonocardia sp. D17]